MTNKQFIFTICPQLAIHDGDDMKFDLGDGLTVFALDGKTRRLLLDACQRDGCSDDLIVLLHKSELLISIEIDLNVDQLSDFRIAFFQYIGQEIVKRFYNSMRLLNVEWIPQPLHSYPWFYRTDSLDETSSSCINVLDSKWTLWDQPSNINWRQDDVKPIGILCALALMAYDKSIQKNLGKINQISKLKLIIEDQNKINGYLKSANKYVEQKTFEFIQIRNEDEIAAAERDGGSSEIQLTEKCERGEKKIVISDQFYAKWFIDGFLDAIAKEVNKMSYELGQHVLDNRVERAYQFFNEAFAIRFSGRYLMLMATMESLLGTDKQEVTFQIASRASWLLHPDDYDKRIEEYKKIKKLYNLRSSIIHGSKYKPELIHESIDELLSIIQKTFVWILSKDEIFAMFFGGDCSEYLNSLCMGRPSDK